MNIGEIGHAYLFSGPECQGKKTLALLYAKGILCIEAGSTICCDCVYCRKVDKGIHPDLKMIKPDGNHIKINQIRAIKQELSFKPTEGSKKNIYYWGCPYPHNRSGQ